VSRLDDIAGRDDIFESISLGHDTALLALAADHQDSVVFLCHITHGGVTANELARVDLEVELATEIEASLFLGLTTAIGEENVRTKQNAIRMFRLKGFPSLNSAGNRKHRASTHTLTPYGFSPLMYFIASTAAGIGFPPLMRTPSMSKASAKSSLVTAGGLDMGVGI
jgi:hypothetical protein